jgi:hypothetical protein
MDLWSPPHDRPHLFEWWRPLMLVSRRARLDRFPWPVHLDEFRLAGRVRRPGRPDIWIYDHHENRGSVCVDATGQTYKFVATPRGRAVGRFQACDVPTALWRARLPDVVQPVRYDEGRAVTGDDWSADEAVADGGHAPGDDASLGEALGEGAPACDADGPAGDGDGAEGAPRVIRRGHLTLIAG